MVTHLCLLNISIHMTLIIPFIILGISSVLLHGPSMFAVKAKINGVIYNRASSIGFDETSS